VSIIKGLVLEYLTRNNQGRRQKNFQKRAIEKKKRDSTPRKPSFISCGGLADAQDNCPGPNLKNILHHELRIKVKNFLGKHPFPKKMPTFKKLSGHFRAKKTFCL